MFGSYPYIRGKNHFEEYIHQDRAIRAAIGDCSADEFREILTDTYEKEKELAQDWLIDVSCCDMMISLILSVLCRRDKLKAFYEVRRNVENRIKPAQSAKYALLVSCLNNDDESAEFIIRNELDNADFNPDAYFAGPLYFLMLTGKYHLVSAALERYRDIWSAFYDSDETGGLNSGCREFALPAASAAFFGDRDFLTAMFDCGYFPDDHLVVQLYSKPEAMEFIIGNFYDKIGLDKPVGIYEFIKEKFGTEKILEMALQIRSLYGDEAFASFTEGLRPMKKTDRLSSSIIMLYSPPIMLSDSNAFIRASAEKELTIVMNDNEEQLPFYDAERMFPEHSITYDMTQCKDENIFWTFSDKELKDILKKNIILDKSNICGMVRAVLDSNSKQLTRLLINKGMINKDNYEEVLDYVLSNKYLNALAVLNNADFRGICRKE